LRAPEGERRPRRRWVWPPAVAVPIVAALVAIAVSSAHPLWLAWALMLFVFFRFARRGYRWRSRGRPEPGLRY
jgi:hypothetical protein